MNVLIILSTTDRFPLSQKISLYNCGSSDITFDAVKFKRCTPGGMGIMGSAMARLGIMNQRTTAVLNQ